MKLKWPILFLLFVTSAHAQMYRWVDADGKVNYSDKLPPAAVSKMQKKSIASGESDQPALTYALSEAVKNHPVVLYTSGNCLPCNEGRTLLKSRGIPFAEKTIATNDDIARLKQAGGNGQLPYFTVGRNARTGFEASAWNTLLTAAGYPESSQLPANYRFSAPEPASPPPPVEPPPPEPTPPVKPEPVQQSAPGTIPGFRF